MSSSTACDGVICDRAFEELTAGQLHDLLRLRVDVFVVEQACAYPELDGRDTEPTTRHVWVGDGNGVASYLRVLDDGEARRIGRVVTRHDARGAGLSGRLVGHVLDSCAGPWVLDAQIRLRGWYEDRGFVVVGDEFVEDGIRHVPMRRPA